jgi:riboflavin synthase
MFTGIIETLGQIRHINREGSNLHIQIASPISHKLRIDQSVAHDGVCLTVVALADDTHTVTAVEETLQRSNLAGWSVGSPVNLERAMKLGDRLDGHMVQGHVDNTALCTAIDNRDGSWRYEFRYLPQPGQVLVDKGSVCVNGVSLTVVDPGPDHFAVAIIPFTYEHTNFRHLQVGDTVNLEFDILGKYIPRLLQAHLPEKA